jgi:hypothetical protein
VGLVVGLEGSGYFFSLTEFEPRTVHPVTSCYTDYSTLAQITFSSNRSSNLKFLDFLGS